MAPRWCKVNVTIPSLQWPPYLFMRVAFRKENLELLDRCLSLGIASPTVFMGFSFLDIGINIKGTFRILRTPPNTTEFLNCVSMIRF